jgi:hypothetical protein
MRPNLPSHTAHRAALPNLRLSEEFGIAVSFCMIVSARRSSFFPSRTSSACAPSDACSLGRSRSAAQLNVGKRPASKGVTKRYEGLWRSPSKSTTFTIGQTRLWPIRANIVRLSIGSRRKNRARRRSRKGTDPEVTADGASVLPSGKRGKSLRSLGPCGENY